VTADSGIGRRDRLQRPPPQIGREDDVDDVLRRQAARRRDRVDDRNRTLGREPLVDSDLLCELPSQRVDSDSPELHPAARQKPVLPPGFSWRQSRMRSLQRRSAETRMRARRHVSDARTNRSRSRPARSAAARPLR
jgi:hypothetical protein